MAKLRRSSGTAPDMSNSANAAFDATDRAGCPPPFCAPGATTLPRARWRFPVGLAFDEAGAAMARTAM
jgi:hypothetical protein